MTFTYDKEKDHFIAVVDDNLSDLTVAGFLIEREGFKYKLLRGRQPDIDANKVPLRGSARLHVNS